MTRQARLTDMHEGICDHGQVCCPHFVSGPIVEGSPDVNVNNLKFARLHDGVTHDCPHCGTGEITTGSSTVFANGLPAARIGDTVTYPAGSGKIVEGSGDTFTE